MIDVLIRSLHDEFGYGVWIYDKNEATGKMRVLKLEGAFKWEPYVTGTLLPKPIFSTSTREGDLLFDKFIERLKEMGYGKDKLSIESGELKAMREHLADMKKLVFTPPPHFAPATFGNATSGLSMLGRITPGRAVMPGSEHYGYDRVAVRANRVRRAAKQCSNAREVLAELFPEVFRHGWKNKTD